MMLKTKTMLAAAMAAALTTGTATAADPADHDDAFPTKWRCSGWRVSIDRNTKMLTARSRSRLKTIVLSPAESTDTTAVWGLGDSDAVSCAASSGVCAEANVTGSGDYTLHLRTKKNGDLRRCRPRD
jgi:hypothetical protein